MAGDYRTKWHSLLLYMGHVLEVDIRGVRRWFSTSFLRDVGAVLDYYSVD